MLLKNNSARLITINGKLNERGERTEKYQVLPGKNPAVEVPDELCKSEFVKALIAAGALIPQGFTIEHEPVADVDTSDESIYADFDKAQLVAQCEARDIKVTSRDTAATLVAKLEAADE
ncbi:MAG: hypothetical protein WBH21_06440 [Vibrio anguillarum]